VGTSFTGPAGSQERGMRELEIERRRTPAFSLSLDQTLHASDEILELLPVATCICDLDGRILQYNRRAVELWGRAPQPGQTHDEFTAASRFFGSNGEELPRSLIAEVLGTGRAIRDEEIEVERTTGRIAVHINIDPLFDARGKMVGVIHCFQDISERKRAVEALASSQRELREQEERWAATYEHAAIGIVEIDAHGKFLRVNEAICDITGLTREQLLGWTLFSRTHPEDRDADEELYRRQVAGEIGFYSTEKRFIRSDGRVIWCSIRSSTVRDNDGNFLYCVRVVQDITARREAEERQKLLIDELNHRVKNTLATVQSLATQTARGADSPEEFRQSFEGRLIALSHAHDQLTRRHWQSADLRDLLVAATAPYNSPDRGQIVTEGEAVTLVPRAALTLSLAFHELTTNAAKYGALSSSTGRIEVRWRLHRAPPEPVLLIEWQEHSGPPVAAPARQGFGSRFIVHSIASELKGHTKLDYAEGGLRCTIEIPLHAATPQNAIDDEKGSSVSPA
jgi:PAS domain S-box-containing protein